MKIKSTKDRWQRVKKRQVVWEQRAQNGLWWHWRETRERTNQPSNAHSSQEISKMPSQASRLLYLGPSRLWPDVARISTWGTEIILIMQHCGEPVSSAQNYTSSLEKCILMQCPGNMFETGHENMECTICWVSTGGLCEVLGLLEQIWAILASHLVERNFCKELLQEKNKNKFIPEQTGKLG